MQDNLAVMKGFTALTEAEQQVIAHLVREHQQQDQQRTGAAKR